MSATVDGSEIRRSPVEVGSLSHYLQGFIHSRWLAGFLNHQQYHLLSLRMTKHVLLRFHFIESFLQCREPNMWVMNMSPPIHHDDCLQFRFLRNFPKHSMCFSDGPYAVKKRRAFSYMLRGRFHPIRRGVAEFPFMKMNPYPPEV